MRISEHPNGENGFIRTEITEVFERGIRNIRTAQQLT